MKFYYINLNKSKKRNENMIAFFNNLSLYLDENIDYNRIEGLDANSEDNLDNYIKDGKFKNMLSTYVKNSKVTIYGPLKIPQNNTIYTKELKKGEFGCLYSHIKAISDFYNTEDNVGLICEDDLSTNFIYNKEYFKEKFNSLVHDIDKYGIISLSCVGSIRTIKFCMNTNKQLHKFEPYFFYGTGCYIINRKTAKYILDNISYFDDKLLLKTNNTTSYVSDNYIYTNTNAHFLIPSLFFTNEEFETTICNNTSNHKQVQELMQECINKPKSSYKNNRSRKRLSNNQLLALYK
jgi:GR25 family glycosyltransferase involved in LPS biosynthesis